METTDHQADAHQDKGGNEFDAVKYESMFQKQMQILDTDYSTYAVVYTCQDNAEFEDKSGNEIPPQAVI